MPEIPASGVKVYKYFKLLVLFFVAVSLVVVGYLLFMYLRVSIKCLPMFFWVTLLTPVEKYEI